MHGIKLSPQLIRFVLFVLFYLIVRYFRAAKLSKSSEPATSKGPQMGETLRDTMRKAGKWVGPRGGYAADEEPAPVELSEPVEVSQQLEQLPTIQPESSSFPTFLLLMLLACLCVVAYRYFTR